MTDKRGTYPILIANFGVWTDLSGRRVSSLPLGQCVAENLRARGYAVEQVTMAVNGKAVRNHMFRRDLSGYQFVAALGTDRRIFEQNRKVKEPIDAAIVRPEYTLCDHEADIEFDDEGVSSRVTSRYRFACPDVDYAKPFPEDLAADLGLIANLQLNPDRQGAGGFYCGLALGSLMENPSIETGRFTFFHAAHPFDWDIAEGSADFDAFIDRMALGVTEAIIAFLRHKDKADTA